jgi:hypothetical protein
MGCGVNATAPTQKGLRAELFVPPPPASLTLRSARGHLARVGKHDSRNSMKMKRRKGQASKKARLKRRAQERKAAIVQGGKKAAAPRKSPRASAAAAQAAIDASTGPAS